MSVKKFSDTLDVFRRTAEHLGMQIGFCLAILMLVTGCGGMKGVAPASTEIRGALIGYANSDHGRVHCAVDMNGKRYSIDSSTGGEMFATETPGRLWIACQKVEPGRTGMLATQVWINGELTQTAQTEEEFGAVQVEASLPRP